MQPDLLVLYIVYFISIGIQVVALLVALAFVIPLQIKEARIIDGLTRLRKLMLASGITIITLSTVSVIVLSARFFIPVAYIRYITVFLVLAHSIGFLILALILRSIYTSKYVDTTITQK